MTESLIPTNDSLIHLEVLANNALSFWDLPAGTTATLINLSENATYLVETPDGHKSVLRVHRENYHTRLSIECELAWIDALHNSNVVYAPRYYLGKNGSAIQQMMSPKLATPRFLVLFHFIDGSAPDETSDLTRGYMELGKIAAHCHNHASYWNKPQPFERLTWDMDAIFGDNPTWGNWRNAPEVTDHVRNILTEVEFRIKGRLETFGKSPTRYNLIHADMRPANLLIDDTGMKLIDFDDCGFGWFMYDFAASISFIEDSPRIPVYKRAWLAGYQSIRSLSDSDVIEIDTFIMLRRMALLAWIGSHCDAPEPQKLMRGFAGVTAHLGQKWIDNISTTVFL